MLRKIKCLAAAICLSAGVAACDSIGTAERLALTTETVSMVVQNTGHALDNDLITVKQACVVHEYGRMAEAALKTARNEYVVNGPDSAEEHIDAASAIINGLANEAVRRAEDACAGINN